MEASSRQQNNARRVLGKHFGRSQVVKCRIPRVCPQRRIKTNSAAAISGQDLYERDGSLQGSAIKPELESRELKTVSIPGRKKFFLQPCSIRDSFRLGMQWR